MSRPIIQVEQLSKKYRLGVVGSTTLRDDIGRMWSRFRGGTATETKNEFSALRDVSFQVQPGEVVGIIGRNGAGKSTLLKILSRITGPSAGRVVLRGRVASLLEVGTGFHEDLTGRENVFLNGSILGLRRAEIATRFDQIVAFAEVERFIDSPVKHYSSGMRMRLAFAVAAYLEPDILIIDEVLAVGDAAFQNKCLDHLQSTVGRKRTIIFVSHQLDAVRQLTSRCIWLAAGRIVADGHTSEILDRYLEQFSPTANPNILATWTHRQRSDAAEVRSVDIKTSTGSTRIIRQGQIFSLEIVVEIHRPIAADIAVVFENRLQTPLFTTHWSDTQKVTTASGTRCYRVVVNPNLLRTGHYLISVAVFSPENGSYYDVVYHLPAFEVAGTETGHMFPSDSRWGSCYIPFSWSQPPP